MGNLLLSRYRYVLVQSELIFQLNSLGVIIDDTIFVFGARLGLGHFAYIVIVKCALMDCTACLEVVFYIAMIDVVDSEDYCFDYLIIN